MSNFTTNRDIIEILKELEELKKEKKRFSDIEDAHGHQYVDLVQEGGGVLGIALVGYTYVLEKAGIRFFSLAGTSAGAINTILMAGFGTIEEEKSEKILKALSEKDLFDFVDGDKRIKRLINKIIKKEKGILRTVIFRAILIYKILKRKLGLNPGANFQNWISQLLQEHHIVHLNDLLEVRKNVPEGFKSVASNKDISDLEPKLAIITSDITTHTKAEFPRMSELYWQNPNQVPLSEMVRASMSIPFFFEPFEIENIPNKGTEDDSKWIEHASYYGPIPATIKFVDGGMLSNFPINVFHRTDGGVPRMPTFGARLSVYRENYSNATSILGICGAMISTMRQIHDYDFLCKNPDFKQLICRIDADAQFNWLDFNMKGPEQVKLFNLGAKKALEFLQGFDWEQYKIDRERLVIKG